MGGVSLSTSTKNAEEGDRVRLSATLKARAAATTITLERWSAPYFGSSSWEAVDAAKVRGRREIAFDVVAPPVNSERYRVSVAYNSGKSHRSRPVTFTVWRWIALSDFEPYYETSGVGPGIVSINGQQYQSWGPYYSSNANSWEARFTPGRNCKAFAAVIGGADPSDDGSTGTIRLTADDNLIYESASLTPGMDQRIEIPLALPYRFGIVYDDTSAAGLRGWPAMGDPGFLCTGVPT